MLLPRRPLVDDVIAYFLTAGRKVGGKLRPWPCACQAAAVLRTASALYRGRSRAAHCSRGVFSWVGRTDEDTSEGAVDEGGLAAALGVEREAVWALLRLAEEKLANGLEDARAQRESQEHELE